MKNCSRTDADEEGEARSNAAASRSRSPLRASFFYLIDNNWLWYTLWQFLVLAFGFQNSSTPLLFSSSGFTTRFGHVASLRRVDDAFFMHNGQTRISHLWKVSLIFSQKGQSEFRDSRIHWRAHPCGPNCQKFEIVEIGSFCLCEKLRKRLKSVPETRWILAGLNGFRVCGTDGAYWVIIWCRSFSLPFDCRLPDSMGWWTSFYPLILRFQFPLYFFLLPLKEDEMSWFQSQNLRRKGERQAETLNLRQSSPVQKRILEIGLFTTTLSPFSKKKSINLVLGTVPGPRRRRSLIDSTPSSRISFHLWWLGCSASVEF